MDCGEIGNCSVCGNPADILITEMCNGTQSSRSFCWPHVPEEMWEKLVDRPDWTPAEEIAFLRKHLAMVDQQTADPAQRARIKAKLETMIAEIQADQPPIGNAAE